jgi:glycosyltransferase involved in cell wall biosynthesis
VRVLQVCPLWYAVSPDAPGGIESQVGSLGPVLASAGCQLTYLAAAGSRVPGTTIAVVDRPVYDLMADGEAGTYEPYEQHQLALASERMRDFDLVHSHIGPNGFVLSRLAPSTVPVIHTLHNPVLDDQLWFLRRHPKLWITTVSEFQRARVKSAGLGNRCDVVCNGVDTSAYDFSADPSARIAFLGRLDRHKGPDLAVKAAIAAGRPIDVAGPMTTPAFFEETIKPLLTEPHRYIGVVRGQDKGRFLGNAACLVMPSRWPEPFGIVAIEAMACGTPVVALRSGALPEIVEDGVSGYVVDHEDDLARAIGRIDELDRRRVREHVVRKFDLSRTADRWMQIYKSMREAAA